VFETQTSLAQLKCKIEDLYQIIDKISPGFIPIPGLNFTPATQITWSDPNSGNTPTLQHVLELIKVVFSLLENTSLDAVDVNCVDSNNQTTDLQTQLNSLYKLKITQVLVV
jgi:hypothetical protein